MKTPTVLLPLLLCILHCGQCFPQSPLYTQSHKEIEYNYGVIADEDLPLISEIEKIKYAFRYSERRVLSTIDENYDTFTEIIIDSDGYEQPWMNLMKHFKYSPSSIEFFDKQGLLTKTISYSDEERDLINEIRNDIRDYGFHPGLPKFPSYTSVEIQLFNSQGLNIHKSLDGVYTIEYPENEKEVYDSNKLTVTKEWYDDNGFRRTQTDSYEPYVNNGYLLRISKSEKFLHSENGPCITEVKLIFYSDYKIKDNAQLMDRATGNIDSIFIFPNPNNGIFTVSVMLSSETKIINASIINIMTGTETPVDIINGSGDFTINKPDLPPGTYSLKLITNNTILSKLFMKN